MDIFIEKNILNKLLVYAINNQTKIAAKLQYKLWVKCKKIAIGNFNTR